jgi:hypothetical protein
VGSVGAEEWQPKSRRDVVRSAQSEVVDIFRWPSERAVRRFDLWPLALT